jgi:alpha-glucosidase
MNFLHDVPSPPALGQPVLLRVRVPRAEGVREVYVRTTPDGEPRFTRAHQDGEWWSATIEARNPVTNYRFYVLYTEGRQPVWLTAAGVVDGDLPDDRDFRLVPRV